MRDGTRLAADILRPARDGVVEAKPLPVIWLLHRYLRASLVLGKLRTILDELPWARILLQQGYIIAVVDARGSGASFGTDRGIMDPAALTDGYDVTEWLAAQPWSDGNIGMMGRSYMGQAQLITASTRPPHLRAIFPEMASFDAYADIVEGGIPRVGFLPAVALMMKWIDQGHGAVPVDEDPDGKLLDEAVKDHQQNAYGITAGTSLPFRDSRVDQNGELPWLAGSTHSLISDINQSKIPIYHLGGWFDLLEGNTLLWYANVDNPQKVLIGPWYHDDKLEAYDGAEHLRWFDYWLKGIDNGVMTTPPILYYTVNGQPGHEWRTTRDWPLPNAKPIPLYLRAGPTGTIKSAYDGRLRAEPPTEARAGDDYIVDYDSASGQASRWAVPSSPGQPRKADMAALDRTGVTYTTDPMPTDVEITGYPVVHLWLSATAPDADVFAFLQEVDGNGTSRPISDGALRASHRALAKPPYENFDLPYHSGLTADVAPLPPPPIPSELVFSLSSTSYTVKAGRRIRLAITGADKTSAQTPELTPPPTLTFLRSVDYPSYVTLPVIPPR